LKTSHRSLLLTLPLLFAAASCATVERVGQSFTNVFKPGDGKGPGEVDGLLGRIERVYVECEMSQERSRTALETLETLVASDFSGDPVNAYKAFAFAVEDSQEQEQALAGTIGPMKEAAEPFFDQWASDLSEFSNMDMRLHSQNRLTETRDRYEAILVAVEPARASYKAFNNSLADYQLFLSHDFNASAVSAIEGEVRALAEMADELDMLLGDAREAAQHYVRTAALRGQLDAGREADVKKQR
jgi:hypothetical protein